MHCRERMVHRQTHAACMAYLPSGFKRGGYKRQFCDCIPSLRNNEHEITCIPFKENTGTQSEERLQQKN